MAPRRFVQDLFKLILLGASLSMFAACGGSSPGGSGRADNAAVPPPDPGETRAGESYRVQIQSNQTGDDIVFQVLEPENFSGDESYPLVLHSHGFGNARATSRDDEGVMNVGNIKMLVENNYGVISIDMRGHGESGGLIRVHDPDGEIQDVIQVVDWAQDNLPWVTRRFSSVSGQTDLVLGSVGASYGAQFALLLNAIDPQKRLDAMVPSNTWNDVAHSLVTNDVLKSGWVNLLFGAGTNAGDRNNFDPFVQQILVIAEATNRMSDEGKEFLRYHSFDYFCDGVAVETNGGAGTMPLQPPNTPPAIPALFTQGLRDTLFDFNEALANYQCLLDAGSSDVRMITYQAGHNTIFPGPGVIYQNPQPTGTDRFCASLTYDDAMLAFLDEHLKLQTGRADAVLGPQNEMCLSLDVNNAIIVTRDQLKIGGQAFSFTDAALTANQPQPTVVGEVFTAGDGGVVIAGIPTASIELSTVGIGTDPIAFIGIGHRRASGNGQGVWDTMDNQVTPIRGVGTHEIDLSAVSEQLQAGDEIAVLLYGTYVTHAASGTRDPASAAMQLTGTVNVPVLIADEYRIAPQR